MAYYFGDLALGAQDHLTGPTADSWTETNTWGEHQPARGKPALQEIGEELDTRELSFFFSEEFCDVEANLARLKAARASKTPEALINSSGPYFGKRYVVEEINIQVQKTDRAGRIVRVGGIVHLTESPVRDLGGLFQALARAAAVAIEGAQNIGARL